MTEIEAKKIIEGKLACMTKCGVFERDQHINSMDCDNCSYCYEQGDFGQQKEALQVAIQALEKKIPKKPILKHDVSVMHINRGDKPHEWKRLESDNWHCPECDSFVGERVYVHSKVHDQRKKKYCDNCGQKMNWESDEE